MTNAASRGTFLSCNTAGAKALLYFAAAAMAAVAFAYEVPFGGDFAEAMPDGFPAAWCWFDYQAYLPHAEAKVERAEGGNALHYFGAVCIKSGVH